MVRVLEVFDAKQTELLVISFDDVDSSDTIKSIKKRIAQKNAKLTEERQSLRTEPKGKSLPDDQKLSDLGFNQDKAVLFVRDFGPQIAWKTVFLFEYFGPLLIYPIFYSRPWIIYGEGYDLPAYLSTELAFYAWTGHYLKRIFETQFIHRFGNSTMPQFNVIKNCSYYWGFAAFVAYFVNHPYATEPYLGTLQSYLGILGFVICEFGNLSIHILLRNLRPAGTRERRIPQPDGNPLSLLYDYVSCPNYTYEICAWLCFSFMTQSLPALMFTTAGFCQMVVWAQGKHRNYLKEFVAYPKSRKALVPFVL